MLLPFLCPGQKIEISEMVGYSAPTSPTVTGGGCDGISAGYYFTKHFSLNAAYEWDHWSVTSDNYGLAAIYHTGSFYAGADGYSFNIRSFHTGDSASYYYSAHYTPGYSIGIFAGGRHEIVKHLFIKGEVGFSRLDVHETLTNVVGAP